MITLVRVKNLLLNPLIRLSIRHPSLQESKLFLMAMAYFPTKIAKTYDQRLSKDRETYQEPIRAALAWLSDFHPTILDLGCGTGVGTILASDRFPEASITAVDKSPEMIKLCKQKVQEQKNTTILCEVADARALPYPDGSFSLVLSSNAPVYLEEAVRVLKPYGTVVYVFSFAAKPFLQEEGTIKKLMETNGLQLVYLGSTKKGVYLIGKRT